MLSKAQSLPSSLEILIGRGNYSVVIRVNNSGEKSVG